MHFRKITQIIFGFTLVYFFVLSLWFNFSIQGEQQFSYLSKSFISGKTYFLEIPGNLYDTVFWEGKYYWPLAPFPSILLIPFVWIFANFGLFFLQGYMQFFLSLGVFYLAYKLANQSGFSKRDSLFLSFGFCFASVYQLIALVSWSWYFVQAVTTLLLFLAIYEHKHKQRMWLIGIYMAGVFASRFTAGIGLIYFLMNILSSKKNLKSKTLNTLMIVTPVFISGIALLFYNQVRFGNIFENGYRLTNNATMTEEQRFELLNYGLFKLKNIPTNFYYYFIKTVDPVLVNAKSLFDNTYYLREPFIKVNYPGTSFFVVSPIFLYLFRSDLRKKQIKFALITCLLIMFMLLCYYWVGWRQVGPRYMLDLMPFLYIILLTSFKKNILPLSAKALIILSAYLNLYLLTTVF